MTEGEGTVSPRCRVRRMFQRRREELALGCYSGGICYTMAPQLNCASIFCCAEAYWNPALEPEAVLADYGRLTFGDELAGIGPLLEEFEVVPDWGYYPPFPFSPQRLEASMTKLLPLLERIGSDSQPRLPVAPTMSEYRRSLLFYADLFRRLATVARALDEVAAVAKAAGKVPADRKELISLDELQRLLDRPEEYPQKPRLRELAGELERLDVRTLTKSYWDTVYGIYGAIPHPSIRAQGATSSLFSRFNCSLAVVPLPSALEKTLKATGSPIYWWISARSPPNATGSSPVGRCRAKTKAKRGVPASTPRASSPVTTSRTKGTAGWRCGSPKARRAAGRRSR